ncbi:hypothetical protein D9M68_999030 [compost metagenome]
MLHLDASGIHQQFGRNMAERAYAVAAIVQFARMFLGILYQVLCRLDRKAGLDSDDRLSLQRDHERLEIGCRIIGRRIAELRRNDDRAGGPV